MTIEEKRTKLLYDVCFENTHCADCKLNPYCSGGEWMTYRGYFNSLSEATINRWFEMVFGEDAEQQEDQKTEDVATIERMELKLIEKACFILDASKNFKVESEGHRIRMDVVKQACICLEILSRCEKMERKCSHADN